MEKIAFKIVLFLFMLILVACKNSDAADVSEVENGSENGFVYVVEKGKVTIT